MIFSRMMLREPRRVAFVIAIVAANRAGAQSTSRVGHAERPLRVEISAGMDRSNGDYYGSGETGTVRSAAVAVRWNQAGWGGVRAAVHGIQRDARQVFHYSPSVTDSSDIQDRVIALTIATDVSFRIWRDLTIAPSAGAGFSPYARGRQATTHTGTSDPHASAFDNYSRTGTGAIWTLGLALRYRRLVIEKEAIGLLGAQRAVARGREYYPLSIGLRF